MPRAQLQCAVAGVMHGGDLAGQLCSGHVQRCVTRAKYESAIEKAARRPLLKGTQGAGLFDLGFAQQVALEVAALVLLHLVGDLRFDFVEARQLDIARVV